MWTTSKLSLYPHKNPSGNRRGGGAVHGSRVQYGYLVFRRIRVGGVSVGDDTAQAVQAAWKESRRGPIS